jgi:hypothetical protein
MSLHADLLDQAEQLAQLDGIFSQQSNCVGAVGTISECELTARSRPGVSSGCPSQDRGRTVRKAP